MDISGLMHLDSYERYQSRLNAAENIGDINRILIEIQGQVLQDYSGETADVVYQQLAYLLPQRVPQRIVEIIYAAAHATVKEEAQMGASAYALLYMKTIIQAASTYYGQIEPEEALQIGVEAVMESASNKEAEIPVTEP